MGHWDCRADDLVSNAHRQHAVIVDLMNSGVGNVSLWGNCPFAPVASSYNPELISHGPIFNMSETFIGAWSQMGVGGMAATLLVNNASARDRSL